MAMVKPVIGIRTAGIVDYIRDGEPGILCEPCELRTTIEAVLDDFYLRPTRARKVDLSAGNL
jgi:hypothetical protein